MRLSMESLQLLQFLYGVLRADLAALQPIQDFGSGRRGIGVDKFQAACDAVEPGFDGRIADSEDFLHLFDGAMAADKGRHENLVFLAQPRQLRQFESPFDDDVLIRDAYPLDQNGLSLSQFG